ncbi:MAG TPA: CvpA family protein [Gallionella sp.]|jgi:membrane protein required for colicin V production
MTGFDYAVIGIMLLSLLLGIWRGLVYEVLSLSGWPLAFILSRQFAGKLEPLLPVSQEAARVALAYALVFIAALIAWGMLVWLFCKLVKAVGLGVPDSLLGGLFGLLRGVLVVLVSVWLAGLSSIPDQVFWRDAKFSKAAEDAALLTKLWLPDNIGQRIHYRNRN